MVGRLPGPAYAAKLREDSWQIVLPTETKTSPISFNSSFRSKADAEAWMRSDQGRLLLADVQRTGRPPSRIFFNSIGGNHERWQGYQHRQELRS